jgi:hypothetical protein
VSKERKALDEFVEKASQQADLRAALDSALRRLDKEKRSKADLVDAVYRAAGECFAALTIPPVKAPKKIRQSGSPEVAVAMLGDLQLGKRTPTYNSDMCEKRVERYAEKVHSLTEIQRKDHPVTRAHVWMLGDMIEGGGNIFPGQQWLIDSSLYRQIALDGPRILANYLRSLLSNFDTVHVSAIIGNHGRIGKWGEYDPETNGDRLLYRVTQQLMQGEKRLTWHIPDGMGERHWYAVDVIGNYSCLLFHGDQMGGKFQGTLTRVATQRKVSGYRSSIPEPFNDVAFGHWHQNYEDNVGPTNVRCNGSTECTNTFAQELIAAKSVPFQRLMYVHPEKGIVTAEHKVWLS